MFTTYAFVHFSIIFFGYLIQNLLLQYFFYYSQKDAPKQWKIQPEKLNTVGTFWGMPLFSKKPNRDSYHRLFATINLCIASCFAFCVAELSVTGRNRMRFDSVSEYGLLNILIDFLIAATHQSFVEYYWHHLMHIKFFYVRFHKFHHHYKSPEPFDDMYIHPLEAIGYYCILYSPPFFYRCHKYSFYGYMLVMGLCGVLDHSGIRFSIPGIYDTVDHDNHHLLYDVNYGFPFPFTDILHGTYHGTYLGWTFQQKNIKKINQNKK